MLFDSCITRRGSKKYTAGWFRSLFLTLIRLLLDAIPLC